MTAKKGSFLGRNDPEDSDLSEEEESDNFEDSEDSDFDSDSSSNEEETNGGEEKNKDEENKEEEEDEVVKAIRKAQEVKRNHPPPIIVEEFITDISFHPYENVIALASISGDVLLYKYGLEENEKKTTLELHSKACRDIEFSEDGKILYSAGKDKSVILTDVETEKFVQLYENAHDQPLYCLTVISENTFATGDEDGTVKLWDRRQPIDMPVFSLKHMEDFVSQMITNDDKRYLVCAGGDGSLTTYNMAAKAMHVQSEEYDEELTCLGLFKRDSKILATSSKGKMYIFNWGEFGLHTDELPSLTKKSIQCMVPITDNIAVTGDESGFLRATSVFPNRHLGIVGQHDFPIEGLDVCNDGTFIASSSHNNDVKFWNVEYFETLDTTKPLKGGKHRQMRHNLPSSQIGNASDFFADL